MSPDGSFIVMFPKGPVGEPHLAGVTAWDGVSPLDSFVPPDVVFCSVPVFTEIRTCMTFLSEEI